MEVKYWNDYDVMYILHKLANATILNISATILN